MTGTSFYTTDSSPLSSSPCYQHCGTYAQNISEWRTPVMVCMQIISCMLWPLRIGAKWKLRVFGEAS
jgi:hypothetical protein